MVNLAVTTFSSGPDDSLATVDIYKVDGKSIVNNINEITDAIDLDNLKSLVSGTLSDLDMDSMIESVNETTGELMVDAKSMLDGIIASNSDLMSALKSMGSDLQNSLLNSSLFSSISGTLNGITSIFTNADLGSLQGISRMINALACSNLPFNFTDIAGLISLGANLIKNAVMMGLGGAFSAFANCPKITTPMLNGIAVELRPYLLSNTNNSLLSEVAHSSAGPYLNNYQPNFISQYMANYNQKGTGNLDYFNEYESMSTSFFLMDPNWNKYGNEINGNNVTTASPTFKRALEAGIDGRFATIDTSDPANINTAGISDDAYMLLVRNTERSNVRSILKEDFPYSKL